VTFNGLKMNIRSKHTNATKNRSASKIRDASVYASLLALCFLQVACSRTSEKDGNSSSTKFRQYYVQGEQLYLKHCSNCHQKDGSGLGLVYPPLNKSDYMNEHFNDVICLIRNGIEGELVVNGKTFNQPMPGVHSLSDLEVAEIATYIFNTWGHKKGMIDVKDVVVLKAQCKSGAD
jgi:cytochrome c551